MSYLGTTIQKLMETNELTQQQVAKRSGLQQSTISRLKNGTQTMISGDDLSVLASALGRNKRQCAEIIAAHLRDHCRGPGADMIAISIRDTPQPAAIDFNHLPRRAEATLRFFAHLIPTSPDTEKALTSFARALGFEGS